MNARAMRACAALLAMACCTPSPAQDDPTEDVQSLALQWTGLERQRNVLESNWRSEQPVLEQQLALLERERIELSDFLEQTATAQDEVEERRLELLERQSELEQQQASLERVLEAAVLRVQGLYRQLPPPMASAWDERIPQLQAEFLTTSERLQVLLEMLGDLDDFDRRLSLHEETMTLGDGEEHLVNEIYLGLAQGWYVSANGSYAGIGRPGANGWEWQASDEAEAVDRVIAILERRRNVELVALPVELRSP
jgi:flagellar motility protein MotE (MotC chaperone)